MRPSSPGIAAAVVVDAARVLLVRRRPGESGLRWQFPAGAVEPGESAGEAAVRETREETGLHVAAVRPLGGRVHPVTGRWIAYTACVPVGGEARVADTAELDAVAWARPSALPRYLPGGLHPAVREYLDTLPG